MLWERISWNPLHWPGWLKANELEEDKEKRSWTGNLPHMEINGTSTNFWKFVKIVMNIYWSPTSESDTTLTPDRTMLVLWRIKLSHFWQQRDYVFVILFVPLYKIASKVLGGCSSNQGRLSPTAMTQTSPSLPFPLLPRSLPSPPSSCPFPPLPPLPGVWGLPRKMEIEIGFGAFWPIFVSKRQLNINIQIRAKRRTYKLRTTHMSGGIPPPSGCNSLPPEPKLRPLPPVDATASNFHGQGPID